MKYAFVISAFAPDPAVQARRLAGFFVQNRLYSSDGTGVILYDPKKTDREELSDISSLLPSGRVICVSAEEYVPENFLPFLKETLSDMDCILFPGNCFGEELCVRLAFRLSGSSLAGVLKLDWKGEEASASKKIYAGHMIGTFRLPQKPCVIAVDKNYPVFLGESSEPEKELVFRSLDTAVRIPDITKHPVETESVLEDADCVVVGGRGLKNRETADAVSRLAEEISAPLAGSRPCVMNAWLPMNRLIGVSGASIAPKVCILLGVSGAPALYSGIGKSRYIIAVNHDKDAPIMKKADLAVCADCVELFQLFIKIVQERCHES